MNEELEELLAIIYNAYEGQVSYATDLWLEGEKHTAEDEFYILRNKDASLSYFKELLIEVKNMFEEHLNHEKIIR